MQEAGCLAVHACFNFQVNHCRKHFFSASLSSFSRFMASFPNSVKILEVRPVTPARDSPESATEFSLLLTYFDLGWLRFTPAECLYFFRLNDSSGSPSFFYSVVFPRLELSLSQTLLHFRPVAGCVTWPSNSPKPMIVHSPNDALLLTLAESNADFDHFTGNRIREAVESHPYLPELLVSNSIASSLALQITFFPNKGFCIGVSLHHGVFDGKSLSMFINAWAYTCKHSESGEAPSLLPELTPSLDRTTTHDPNGIESAYLEYWLTTTVSGSDSSPRSLKLMPNPELEPNLVRAMFQLPRDAINKLKENVLHYHQARSTRTKKLHLSTHVLTSAYVFVCLLKAKRVDSNRKVCLLFPVDCRSRLDPQVPQNYFGNCILVDYIFEEAGALMEENGVAITSEKLSDIVNGLDSELLRGEKERFAKLNCMGPEVIQFGIAGWPRIGFYSLDFGWGTAEKVELAHIDKTNAFSITEIGRGREGAEIGVVLPRPELESFVSLFDNGLKASRSRF